MSSHVLDSVSAAIRRAQQSQVFVGTFHSSLYGGEHGIEPSVAFESPINTLRDLRTVSVSFSEDVSTPTLHIILKGNGAQLAIPALPSTTSTLLAL